MVSIVIPTLFPSLALREYILKLVGYKSVKEVIVVVNGKNDEKGILRQAQDDTHQTIFLGKNKGFTGACNTGAKIAKGEFLLFLNDDCDMSEDALQKMVGFLEQNADVMATQPIITKSLVPSAQNLGHTTIENIGFWVDTKIGKAYPVTVSSNSIQEHQDTREGSLHPRSARSRDDKLPFPSTFNLKPSTRVYGLSGTCLLIRKDIFEKVGMWDELFHSYLEDVDLAIRLHKAGYKVKPCLDAEVTHEHMATSSRMGLYKENKDVINWWRLTLKHPDVFVQVNTVLPLLIERGRNMSGLVKKILQI